MINLRFQEQKEKAEIKQHADYDDNVNWAGKFIQKFLEHSQHSFFTMRMSKNSDGQKYYIEFSFIVPKEHAYSVVKNKGDEPKKVYHPSYATTLDPNQEKEKFFAGFKNTYVDYFRLQKRWNQEAHKDKAFSAFDPK